MESLKEQRISVNRDDLEEIMRTYESSSLLKQIIDTLSGQVFKNKLSVVPSQGVDIDSCVENVWAAELKKGFVHMILLGFYVVRYRPMEHDSKQWMPYIVDPRRLNIQFMENDDNGRREYHCYKLNTIRLNEELPNTRVFIYEDLSLAGNIVSNVSRVLPEIKLIRNLIGDSTNAIMLASHPRVAITKKSTAVDQNDMIQQRIAMEQADEHIMSGTMNNTPESYFGMDVMYSDKKSSCLIQPLSESSAKTILRADPLERPPAPLNAIAQQHLRESAFTQFHQPHCLYPPLYLAPNETVQTLPLPHAPNSTLPLMTHLLSSVLATFELNLSYLFNSFTSNTNTETQSHTSIHRLQQRANEYQQFLTGNLRVIYNDIYAERERKKRAQLKKRKDQVDTIVQEMALQVSFSFNYMPVLSNFGEIKSLYDMGVIDDREFLRYAYHCLDLDKDPQIDIEEALRDMPERMRKLKHLEDLRHPKESRQEESAPAKKQKVATALQKEKPSKDL